MKELTVQAKTDNLDFVLNFILEEIGKHDVSLKVQRQIIIAVEEIYTNIANYAYHPEDGEATVLISIGENPLIVTLQFHDKGKPYNPLENLAPDISCSVEERPIGGLGILIVKNCMDHIEYEYKDGKNILTIKKSLTE
jgi:anti-sigma regulatory factor (Ser/Thr protein kinase)